MNVACPDKAIFLDRDGTLIKDCGYLSDPSKIDFLPGVPDALRKLKRLGYLLVLVSNQSGVARGFFTERDLKAVHDELVRLLAGQDIRLDAYYYCCHGPDDNCGCRKPKPGMALAARRDLNIDLQQSYMVGDKDSDAEFGNNFGAKGMFSSIRGLIEHLEDSL
jgi:D-glycero-D-manno-heptose 1,7-bisphosphate phosphatase